MATLFLVRHGETTSNITGVYMGWSEEDLNENGYSQVRRLSRRLASLPIADVYTSPLKRAFSTAAILAEPHHLEPKVLDKLIEIRLGDWQGLHRDEIKRRWPHLWKQSRIDPSDIVMPDGESFPEVTARAVRAFYSIVEASSGKPVVMITHDIIIRIVVAHVLGVTNRIYRRLEIDNASLSMVRVEGADLKLIKLNDTAHLEDGKINC